MKKRIIAAGCCLGLLLIAPGCFNFIDMRDVAVQNREKMFRLQVGMKRS